MSIGKKLLVGVLLVVLAVGAVGSISFAASKSDTGTATAGFVNGCRGFFGDAVDSLAKLLNLNPDQIIEKRNSGESLADIAKGQGVSQDKVVSTIMKDRKKFLDDRVKAGQITKEQEKLMLDRMESRLNERVTDPAVGPGAGGGMGGPGGCCGGPGARGGAGLGVNSGYRNAPSSAVNAPVNNI
ncbi:MAG: DUF2680 domain-containing protein [Candidatus Aquicultor sp.]